MLSSKIRFWCAVCKWVVLLGMIALVAGWIASPIVEAATREVWQSLSQSVRDQTRVTEMTRLLVYLVAGAGLLTQLFLGAAMFRIFHLFGTTDVFSDKPLKALRMFGTAMFVSAGYRLIQPTLTGLAMTVANPPGAHVLTFALSSNVVMLALAGAAVMVIGQVMVEGSKAINENRQFV